jgi:hypothetical protein
MLHPELRVYWFPLSVQNALALFKTIPPSNDCKPGHTSPSVQVTHALKLLLTSKKL